MAESSPPPLPRGSSPSGVTQLKPPSADDELQHAPAVSSPLNPDAGASRARKAAPAREQREKKDSLKKREAKGTDATRSGTPDAQLQHKSSKKVVDIPSKYPELQRYIMEKPKPNDYKPPGSPVLVPDMKIGELQLNRVTEHVHNKRGYRYNHAIADPEFPHMNYTRQTDVEPYCARFDYEDSSATIQFSEDAAVVTTDKGFRMARANVGLREGRWYWEIEVMSGIRDPANPTARPDDGDFGGHFRAGISRREASLEHPCGYDAYSYAIRDAHGQKFHMSMPEKFFPSEESICKGDVLGFELQLPSLALHRKVVEGTYNKAVDNPDDSDPPSVDTVNTHTLLRDRYPIRYKNELYHEHYDYQPSKELEDRFQPPAYGAPSSAAASQPPNPNHPTPALRTLPNSCLKIFKNGRFMGIAFKDLLAFLPPASKPGAGVRDGLDDSTLGYYPSVGVFSGGAVRANFGPNFAYPQSEMLGEDDVVMVGGSTPNASSSNTSLKKSRPVCERYNEQIAEDTVFDIIDEVDCWIQDGGVLAENRVTVGGAGTVTTSSAGDAASGDGTIASINAAIVPDEVGDGPAEVIKELVQDEE